MRCMSRMNMGWMNFNLRDVGSSNFWLAKCCILKCSRYDLRRGYLLSFERWDRYYGVWRCVLNYEGSESGYNWE